VALASPTVFVHGEEGEGGSNSMSFSSEEEPPQRTRREKWSSTNSNDFRVKILEFEGKLI